MARAWAKEVVAWRDGGSRHGGALGVCDDGDVASWQRGGDVAASRWMRGGGVAAAWQLRARAAPAGLSENDDSSRQQAAGGR